MKTALIADLHANREAVESVLQHARDQGAQQWVFLGDYVGYGADPAWVVDVVREHVHSGALAVQGNHDLAVVRGATPAMRPDPRHVIEWTRAHLDASQIDFLASLPMTQQRDDQLFVHANAFDPQGWAYIDDRVEAQRSMMATPCHYTFCGHMHGPRLFHLSAVGKVGEFLPRAGVAIPVPPHRQWLVIGGAAGQPRDGNPAACYALFDDASRTLIYHRVPYDLDSAGAKILAAKLPQRLASRLGDGQ